MKCKTAIMVIFVLVACSSSALAGCGSSDCFYTCDPREDFGKAFTLAVAGQILNPDADTNLQPVKGIDGRAAVYIMQKYVESFIKTQAGASSGGMTSVAISQGPGGYTK